MSYNQSHPSDAKKHECFVPSPIGSDNSKLRDHANILYDCILKPVVEKNGYHIERADKIDESGLITNQIIKRIIQSDLIIAVLRDLNPNVFYELAVCHIARKPGILMIQKGQTIPFDTSHIRTIFYDIDLRSAKETEDRLDKILQKNLVEDIQNPILMGLDALTLKESNDPEKQIAEGIFDILQSLDNKLAIIQNQLIRQASGDTFNPTRELLSYEDANKRSKKLAKNIIQTFRHAYNIEGVSKKDIKEKDE